MEKSQVFCGNFTAYFLKIKKTLETEAIFTYTSSMGLVKKARKLLHSKHKFQKFATKLKNMGYSMRCARLVSFVKKAPPSYGLNDSQQRRQKIIVSLTSYPARFGSIYLCLKSLLLQSAKPDKIILWLACDQGQVTQEMKSLEQYGLTIVCGVEDLKPHKKYFYSMQEFPNDLIITVDDDVIYPQDLVASLLQTNAKNPGCVCARRVHKITFGADAKINPYSKWIDKCKKERAPSFLLIPTGVGGVLYPPNSLDKRVFDKALIKSHCLMADDIWLKTMELLNGTKVAWVKNNILTPPYTERSQETALYLDNVHQNKNDEYVNNMMDLYGEELKAKGFF